MSDVTSFALGTLRYALGLTLAIAAAWKIRDFPSLRATLSAYGIPEWASWVGAPALVAAEASTAAVAFTPVGDVLVGALGTGLGALFLGGQAYLLATGSQAPCMCFGPAAVEVTSVRTAARAGLVLVAALALLFAGSRVGRPFDLTAIVVSPGVLAAIVTALRWLPAERRQRRPGKAAASASASAATPHQDGG